MFKSEITENEIDRIRDLEEAKSMLTLLAEKIKKEGKIETAKNMKQEGFKVDVISRVTGLSIEEIEKLK